MLGRNKIGLELHRGIEATIGLALVILPILFGFAPSSLLRVSVEVVLVAAVFGLVLAMLGFVATRGGDALPPSLHRTLDGVAAVGLNVAALFFAFRVGPRADVVILALAAFPYALVVLCTRYVPGGPDRATTVSGDRAAG
jgi:hypothetical protein